jgi:hypothetical protein
MLRPMDSMKGHGAVVVSCRVNFQTSIDLLRFADGSWGIQRDQTLTGIWEPAELDQCISVFALQTGIRNPRAQITVLLRLPQDAHATLN